jgi:thioredoxin reductase (NADPH)
MRETPEQFDSMFPKLEDAQIAHLAPFGERRSALPGEILFDQGDVTHGVFVVLEGSIEIIGVSNSNEVIRVLSRGTFTGEVNQLSGRRSLVRCRAREASVLLEIGRAQLRRMVQTDAELSEIFLRVFLLRRG